MIVKAARLIDAHDALEELKQAEKEMKVVTPLGCKAVDIKAVIQYIESRPTVDAVEVVHADWIPDDEYDICSHCNNPVILNRMTPDKFCRNCGARMVGMKYMKEDLNAS